MTFVAALAQAQPAHRIAPLHYSGRALAAFFFTTFGLIAAVALALFGLDVDLEHPGYGALYAIGLISPFLGALAYARISTRSLRPILDLYWPLRFGGGAWMVLAVPGSVALSYTIATLAGLPLDPAHLPSAGAFTIAAIGWSSVMWAEETGWRGVLLPVLQSRLGPISATLIVSMAWTVWHLPLLIVLGMSPAGIGWFAAQSLGLSLAMTWAWNQSGTALVPMLIHGLNNATMMAFVAAVPERSANELMAVQAIGPILLGFVILIVTRGRLGFK